MPDEQPGKKTKRLVGIEVGYVVRSEGAKSTGTRDIARRALADPEEVSSDDIRKLAAAILAHQQFRQ